MADERVPELVRDLEDQITHYLLQETRIDRSRAILISKKVARHITANWGGQLLYIPKNHGGQLSERDICTKFITPDIQQAGWEQHQFELFVHTWHVMGVNGHPTHPQLHAYAGNRDGLAGQQ